MRAVAGPEGAVAADRRGVPQPRRQAPRTRRSPARNSPPSTTSQNPNKSKKSPSRNGSCSSRIGWKTSCGGVGRTQRTRLSRRMSRRSARRPGASASDARPTQFRMRIDPAGLAVHRRRAALSRWSGVAGSAGCSRCRSSCSPAFFVFFFRDPDRRVAGRGDDDDVLSPADGRVLVAGAADGRRGAARRVAADQHLPVADGRAREPRARRPAA